MAFYEGFANYQDGLLIEKLADGLLIEKLAKKGHKVICKKNGLRVIPQCEICGAAFYSDGQIINNLNNPLGMRHLTCNEVIIRGIVV